MDRHNMLERIKKVRLHLSNQNAGERANAERLIADLMRRYNITEADIEALDYEIHWFTFNVQYERDLLTQIVIATRKEHVIHSYSLKHSGKTVPRKVGYMLTSDQAAQVLQRFTMLRKLWQTEIERLFVAFVNKHGLTLPAAPGQHDTTPLEELERLRRMMDSLTDAPPAPRPKRKQLPKGEPCE